MNRSKRLRSRLRLWALVALTVGLLVGPGAAQGTAAGTSVPRGLLLWNTLGSEDEITHSAYGPNLVSSTCADFEFGCGIDVPGTLGYPAGVFGGAASVTGGPYFPTARVHTALLRDSIMNPEHGAVEVWYRQESDPVPYSHNPHRIFGGPYSLTGIDEVNLYSMDANDSGDPRLHFNLFFGEEPPPFTPPHLVGARSLADGIDGYPISAHNGQWIHIAGVWDRNGIAGSADTIRLYVDGQVVAASQESDWGSTTCDRRLPGRDRCFLDVAGCNDTCADTFAVDNLKVWDYAKTDYSDRFQEGFGNTQPDCSGVTATPGSIWPATRDQMALITLSGATDADGDGLSYHIDGVTQDEYVTGIGDDTSPDAALTAAGASSNQVLVRSEANSHFNGRAYRIAYTVDDGHGGICTGTSGPAGDTSAKVGIQRNKDLLAIDDGDHESWNSLTGARVS
jgi:Concanavalin A-like lectin/glucanases superfamily